MRLLRGIISLPKRFVTGPVTTGKEYSRVYRDRGAKNGRFRAKIALSRQNIGRRGVPLFLWDQTPLKWVRNRCLTHGNREDGDPGRRRCGGQQTGEEKHGLHYVVI